MSSEVWNIVVSIGAISSATMIRSLVGMLSGPEALCGLRCLRSLMTPRGRNGDGFHGWNFTLSYVCEILLGWLVLLLYVPSQQLWSLRDGQFT